MAKRRSIHSHGAQGLHRHFRRRIAEWRRRGFPEKDVRMMAHLLRQIGPSYQGPSKAPGERAGSIGHSNHAPPDDPRTRTKPQKHHSRYRTKRG